jgi:hypothetical protein
MAQLRSSAGSHTWAAADQHALPRDHAPLSPRLLQRPLFGMSGRMHRSPEHQIGLICARMPLDYLRSADTRLVWSENKTLGRRSATELTSALGELCVVDPGDAPHTAGYALLRAVLAISATTRTSACSGHSSQPGDVAA